MEKNLLFLFPLRRSCENMKQIFQEGSYDYNSNATQRPWYFDTTPFNYRILDHTEHRKKELGFRMVQLLSENRRATQNSRVIDHRVFIVGSVWVEPHSSAAGSRMLQLIQFFLAQKWKGFLWDSSN